MKLLLCLFCVIFVTVSARADSDPASNTPDPARSLSDDLNAEIDSRLTAAGTASPSALAMFSSADDSTHLYVRNPLVWTRTIDLSGIGVHAPQGGGGTFGGSKQTGVLITPTDIAVANHFRFNPGESLIFVDNKNITYTARIVSLVDVAGDLGVEHLAWSGPTPKSLKVMPVLGENYEHFSADHNLNDFPVLCTNQDRQVVVQDAYLPVPFYENNFYHNPATEALRVPFTGSLRIGDSGQPIMAVVRGEAVLLACSYSIFAGPSLADNIPGINRALRAMKSSYQLTLVDLSGFPTY